MNSDNDPLVMPWQKMLALCCCLVVGLGLVAIGQMVALPFLITVGLVLNASATGALLINALEQLRERQSTVVTHRCRLYRTGDGLTESSHAGSFVELWDTKGHPRVQNLPRGKLWKTFTGASGQEVRGKIDYYRLKHDIMHAGDYDSQGMI
jgi:hypothetical protein